MRIVWYYRNEFKFAKLLNWPKWFLTVYFFIQATLITSLEEELFCCFYTDYYDYIRKHCNPLVKKYKEDEKMLQSLALKPKVCFNFRRGNIIVLKPIKRYVIRMNT